MSLEIVSNLFAFLGGLGMLLYGMTIMGDGMQKAAGSKVSKFLGMVTNNRLMGVLLGAGITALIQSSSATTVMVVGFVNAGVLNLSQAMGVIMGANIGTTVTAWIVSLTQVSGDAMSVFSPDFFAPLLVGIGAFLVMFAKKSRSKLAGEICIGLGLLFIGLSAMSGALAPYTDLPIFGKAFMVLGGNPILGILTGAVVTGLIHSSAASVSILQTLALSGVVTRSAGIYITLGQNIGTCVTAIISAAGTSRTAKRAAVMHLLFNVSGAIVFGVLVFLLSLFVPDVMHQSMTAVDISMFHTVFNVTVTILLFPFADFIVAMSGKLVKESASGVNADGEELTKEEQALQQHLDQRILESPALAIEAAREEVLRMARIAEKNVALSVNALIDGDMEEIEAVFAQEKVINRMQRMLTDYLVKINNLSLNEDQKQLVTNLFNTITDVERAGDHAENLAEQAQYVKEHNIDFSETGAGDLRKIADKVLESFGAALEARETGSLDAVLKTASSEDEVDELEEDMREEHIERLSNGKCNSSAGVVFLDAISNLERISDHAYNIAGYVRSEL